MAIVETFAAPTVVETLGAPTVVETFGAPVVGAPTVVETIGAPTIAAAPVSYATAAPVSYATAAPVSYAAAPVTTARTAPAAYATAAPVSYATARSTSTRSVLWLKYVDSECQRAHTGSLAMSPTHGAWTQREKREVSKLAAIYEELNPNDYIRNLEACIAYLKQLEVCSDHLHVELAPRLYRSCFSINYRTLFKHSKERQYRADVLQASFQRCPDMWINDKLYVFSVETTQNAHNLAQCFQKLGSILASWTKYQSHANDGNKTKGPAKGEMANLLAKLDNLWATFESLYIEELMTIEATARKPLADAVEHERRVALLERPLEGPSKQDRNVLQELCIEELQQLFACLAKLNATANENGVGRSDFSAETLLVAQEVQRDAESGPLVRALAEDFLDSFRAMRRYLREVGCCMERVNPHLHKNIGLVARLEDIEKAWEACRRYVESKGMRDALEHVTESIEAAQSIVPDFRRMCLDCDVELFMVLPRIVLLSFLKAPKYDMLLKSLFPVCFRHELVEPSTEKRSKQLHNLHTLIDKFNSTQAFLVDAQRPRNQREEEAASSAAWEILTQRAVHGTDLDNGVYGRLTPSLQEKSRSAVEEFMHELEAWSIDLQRHCPKDWNSLSATLVQWISGSLRQDRQIDFCT